MNLYDYSFAAKPISELSAAPKGFAGTAFDFQYAAVQQYPVRKHCYFAHHPGAGKTPMALLASRYYSEADPIIIICPPSIVGQWARQAERWTGLSWLALTNTSDIREWLHVCNRLPARYIVPDSLVHEIPDVAWRFALIVWDEAHRGKARDARRTRAFYGNGLERGLAQRADKILCLSGTPMPNSPIELFPFLHAAFPSAAPTFAEFANRYCPPQIKKIRLFSRRLKKVINREVLSYDTAINKEELSKLLRDLAFVRPKKEVVLGQLPPLRTEIVSIKSGLPTPGISAQTIADIWGGYVAASEADKQSLAKERHLLGLRKALLVPELIQTYVEGGDAPVVWTWHRDVAIAIGEKLGFSVVHGGLTPDQSTMEIDRFTSGETPGFVGTIAAAGTGIDGLQNRSDLCIFVERSHVPRDMEQAVGRLLRIGQTGRVRMLIVHTDHPVDQGIALTLARKEADIAEIVG